MTARPQVASARRVVLKLGTRVLTHEDGRIALARLFSVVEAAARLLDAGREVLVVSSGAVGLGRDALGIKPGSREARELSERQACAAVGQTRLMGLYEAGFSRLGRTVGQVLLTEGDFHDRQRYLNLRSTLLALLRRSVVPIINENDAVSVEELSYRGGGGRPVFGDNDRLSALVATHLDADLLVLLTDVDGVYDRDPRRNPDARLRSIVEVGAESEVQAGDSVSGVGRGGMRSKVEAATIAARAGVSVVIASGLAHGALDAALAGAEVGTLFPARAALTARRSWIAWATAPRGGLTLDAGAVAALRERGASLLAAGVCGVVGSFEAGDVVELRAQDGGLVGRGMVCCDAETARRWARGERPSFARNHHALVHRDHLVLGT